MSLTITTTEVRVAEPERLRLILRRRVDAPEAIERLGRLLEEWAASQDELSLAVRAWARELPREEEALIERIKQLRTNILFDPLDQGPLEDAWIVSPELVVSTAVLEDWRRTGEAVPFAGEQRHELASAVIEWARGICPEERSLASIRSVAEPELAQAKHFIYLARAKDAQIVLVQRAMERESRAREARLLGEAAVWLGAAGEMRAAREREAAEHERRMGEGIEQLQQTQAMSEVGARATIGAQREASTAMQSQVAYNRSVISDQQQQIAELQGRLRR